MGNIDTTYRGWVANELREWADTFRDEDFEESEDDAYNDIMDLANRVEHGDCSQDDYENVMFHLWQKNGQDE
jgi:hypothetical protein